MEELYLDDYVQNAQGNYVAELSNGKTVVVPHKEIENFMTKGKTTEIDAIEMWLADNGHLDSEEQNALDEIAKKVKIDHKASADKPKKEQKPRVVKVSDDKKQLFSEIYDYLCETVAETGRNVQIVKENKLISVQVNGKTFKIDLIEQRKPKK